VQLQCKNHHIIAQPRPTASCQFAGQEVTRQSAAALLQAFTRGRTETKTATSLAGAPQRSTAAAAAVCPDAVAALQEVTILAAQLLPEWCCAAAAQAHVPAHLQASTQPAAWQQESPCRELRPWVRSVADAFAAAERAGLPSDAAALHGMRRAAAAVVISLQAVAGAGGASAADLPMVMHAGSGLPAAMRGE